MKQITSTPSPNPWRAALNGALAFALVSLAGFSVWAFAGRWFYANVGEAGLYAATLIVFLALTGILLHPLVQGEHRIARFYKAFVPAFVAYALAWSACWFAWRFGAGEWAGSLAGSVAFALLLGKSLKATAGFLKVILVLFLAHSAGYFLGGMLYERLAHPPVEIFGLQPGAVGLLARLGWGICYGLGFGAGIGFAFAVFQEGRPRETSGQKR